MNSPVVKCEEAIFYISAIRRFDFLLYLLKEHFNICAFGPNKLRAALIKCAKSKWL